MRKKEKNFSFISNESRINIFIFFNDQNDKNVKYQLLFSVLSEVKPIKKTQIMPNKIKQIKLF